ncbi:TIGR04104 family putative zinc finger protein [Peribacillus sp. NPDC094092]|uniref:TIGR04104 family putative zinc finger protein n=1 Tax=Peribacillus sp. NPDC094092 TaxID=3390611 RepID=UPI003D069EA9
MPTCQNCGYKWRWRETFVKIFTFKSRLKCSLCEGFQYVSKKSRNRLSLVVFTPFLIWIPLVSFGVPKSYILASELVSYVLVFVLMPFLYKLSNKEEPML